MLHFNNFDHLIRDNAYVNKQKFITCYYSEGKLPKTEFQDSSILSIQKKKPLVKQNTLSSSKEILGVTKKNSELTINQSTQIHNSSVKRSEFTSRKNMRTVSKYITDLLNLAMATSKTLGNEFLGSFSKSIDKHQIVEGIKHNIYKNNGEKKSALILGLGNGSIDISQLKSINSSVANFNNSVVSIREFLVNSNEKHNEIYKGKEL